VCYLLQKQSEGTEDKEWLSPSIQQSALYWHLYDVRVKFGEYFVPTSINAMKIAIMKLMLINSQKLGTNGISNIAIEQQVEARHMILCPFTISNSFPAASDPINHPVPLYIITLVRFTTQRELCNRKVRFIIVSYVHVLNEPV
jgi:hypothetical protein